MQPGQKGISIKRRIKTAFENPVGLLGLGVRKEYPLKEGLRPPGLAIPDTLGKRQKGISIKRRIKTSCALSGPQRYLRSERNIH